jgi:hypothetical protein
LNYRKNVLARIEASDRGADEAILLDRDGHLAEATADSRGKRSATALQARPRVG